MQKLQTELGHSASEPELAQAMGMTLEDFQHMLDEIRGLEVAACRLIRWKMDVRLISVKTFPDPRSRIRCRCT